MRTCPGNAPLVQRLSLIDAINTGLAQNPDLVVLRTTEGVSYGALGVARTYPFNPYVQIQTLALSRKFPERTKRVGRITTWSDADACNGAISEAVP